MVWKTQLEFRCFLKQIVQRQAAVMQRRRTSGECWQSHVAAAMAGFLVGKGSLAVVLELERLRFGCEGAVVPSGLHSLALPMSSRMELLKVLEALQASEAQEAQETWVVQRENIAHTAAHGKLLLASACLSWATSAVAAGKQGSLHLFLEP